MSRERTQSKFRAWDKQKKQTVYGIEETYDGLPYSELNEKVELDIYNHMSCFSSWLCGDYEVMQYTGLKDKNGVEIYEGDIVVGYYDEIDPYFEEMNRHAYTSRILYIDNAFCVNRDTVNEEGRIRNYGYQKDWDCETVEVIGNIYENKNLLEEK